MKEIIIAIIGSGLLSGAMASIISAISTKQAKKKDDTQKLEIGLKLLLLSSLKRDGRDAINHKTISKDDYEAFLASYNAYKALGGDGWADKVLKQVSELPVDLSD
jgi:hypothetical protein